MHDNFSTDALNDQNLDPRTVHITDPSSNESSSSETQEYSQKLTPPSSTMNSSSNDLPRNPKPPSSLLVKFAKRVAICTAVVALARFSYPYLLVIDQNLSLIKQHSVSSFLKTAVPFGQVLIKI